MSAGELDGTDGTSGSHLRLVPSMIAAQPSYSSIGALPRRASGPISPHPLQCIESSLSPSAGLGSADWLVSRKGDVRAQTLSKPGCEEFALPFLQLSKTWSATGTLLACLVIGDLQRNRSPPLQPQHSCISPVGVREDMLRYETGQTPFPSHNGNLS